MGRTREEYLRSIALYYKQKPKPTDLYVRPKMQQPEVHGSTAGKTYAELKEIFSYRHMPYKARFYCYHDEIKRSILKYEHKQLGLWWKYEPVTENFRKMFEEVRKYYKRGLRRYGIEYMQDRPIFSDDYGKACELDIWAFSCIDILKINMYSTRWLC